MRLLIMGPPGVGKGTQAKVITNYFSIPHVSTGDLLRNEIIESTDIGNTAKQYIDKGRLVPDSILLSIVELRISKPDCQNGFLLDGFPRTIKQALGFDNIINKLNLTLNFVISLSANENELVDRLVKRGFESGRTDDTPNIIKKRQKIYWEQTAPLLKFYHSKGLLKAVDGLGEIEMVTQRIKKVIT